MEFFGDTIEAISIIDPLRGVVVEDVEELPDNKVKYLKESVKKYN